MCTFIILIINNNYFYLPDGDMDGLIFEQRGWEWSKDGFLMFLSISMVQIHIFIVY